MGRHQQYAGGVFFTICDYFTVVPAVVFGLLSMIGKAVVYVGCKEEDKCLRMVILLRDVRLLRRRKGSSTCKERKPNKVANARFSGNCFLETLHSGRVFVAISR